MSDLIDRQAAIDRIRGTGYADQIKENVIMILMGVPSAQPQVCDDAISRDDAIMAVKTGALSAATIFGRTDEGATAYYETVKAIKALPSAQPTYTDEEIQKMQDLEQAEIEKAYQLGYEEGKKDAQPKQKMGRWIVKRLYVQCSVRGDCFPLKPQNYCPNCGARMDGESE